MELGPFANTSWILEVEHTIYWTCGRYGGVHAINGWVQRVPLVPPPHPSWWATTTTLWPFFFYSKLAWTRDLDQPCVVYSATAWRSLLAKQQNACLWQGWGVFCNLKAANRVWQIHFPQRRLGDGHKHSLVVLPLPHLVYFSRWTNKKKNPTTATRAVTL